MTDITTIASPVAAQSTVLPILFIRDLPGPLSLDCLATFDALRKPGDSAGYWVEHSDTPYGRAEIVAEITPFGTAMCSMTTAWVRLGGPDLPGTADVISTSHFRSASASHRVHVLKRLTLPEQIIKFDGLPVTTPARMACDLVIGPENIPDPSTVNTLVCQLISAYQFRSNDCLQIVKEHRHHKYTRCARMFFESMQQEMDEPALEQYAWRGGSLSEVIVETAMPLTIYGICDRCNGCLATRRRYTHPNPHRVQSWI